MFCADALFSCVNVPDLEAFPVDTSEAGGHKEVLCATSSPHDGTPPARRYVPRGYKKGGVSVCREPNEYGRSSYSA